MQTTFCSYSFGCRVNQAEKEELDKNLQLKSFVQSDTKPDFYIINTCAVTSKAEREARQLIYQTRKKFPKTKIIVTGCSATKWINEKAQIKEAYLLVDNVNKEYIAELIRSKVKYSTSFWQVPPSGTRPESHRDAGQASMTKKALLNDKYLSSGRLLLKIQDGCQRFCTYCIVPYLRGLPKSKPISEILRTVKDYAKNTPGESLRATPGVKKSPIKEVILAAINTEAYGYDTGESFIDLISHILNQTSIPRISLGSIHPWSINDEFFKFYKKVMPQQRLVNFFHIPLQSGSNKILTLMKRGYTREEFIEKLNILQKINPLAFIGTDIIVGFLEENDHDFTDTYNFLFNSPIAKFHIFRFSKREKTAAYFMAKRLKEPPVAIKIKRAKFLAELGRKKYEQFLEKHIGLTFPALFLERRIEDYQEVLLDNQIPALIRTSKNLAGEIKSIKITTCKQNKLLGESI